MRKRDGDRRQERLAMRPIRLLVVMFAAFAADQISKALALALLGPGTPVAVFPGLSLTLGFNEGVSFGMLSGTMAGRPLVLVAITAALTIWFAYVALRSANGLERFGFGLIVGGSLGNILDRVRQGAVTDFLDLNWGDWRWPTFNIADVAIVAGACAVVASLWVSSRRKAIPPSRETRSLEPGRSNLPN